MKMNFAEIGGIAFVLVIMILGSGCVVSRSCEKVLSVGVTEYYADGSEIKDGVIYEYRGDFFMFAGEVGYQRDPAWLGLAAPPMKHFGEKKIPVGRSETYVLLKLSPAMKEFLMGERIDARDDWEEGWWVDKEAREGGEASLWSGVEVVDALPPGWEKEATVHPVVEEVGPPWIRTMDLCTEFVAGSVPVRMEKTAVSWGLLPLAAVGLAWDIPATVVMSVGLDFVVAPTILVYQCFDAEESSDVANAVGANK